MTGPTGCPDATLLHRLAAGDLSDEAAEAVEGHLLGCGPCLAAVYAVADRGPLIAALRHRTVVAVPQGPEVEAVVGRVRAAADSAANDTLDYRNAHATPSGADDHATEATAPAMLGPYRVVRELGRGGMGVVYEAEDPTLRRAVAVKVMKAGRAVGPDRRERFLREARLAAALTHDNVVPVYHVGEDGDGIFLVMPLLRGESLADRLAHDGRLPAAEILRIGREAAEGLAAAHARGLVHRDIKPANLWLEGDAGRVRILDFGLAQSVETEEGLTRDGMILGTPAYMPPEQTRGAADARSDVYGLGVVLFRAATGRLPFEQADVMALLAAVNLDPPPPVASLAPDVPRPLADLIDRCLAKNPDARPQSARAVADAIRAIESGTAPAVPPRRRRTGALVATALLVAFAAWWCGPAIYRIVTDQGEIVVVSDDPDIEITVKQGGAVVEILDPASKQRVTLKSGVYSVELSRGADRLTLNVTEFALARNGREFVRVTQRPKPVVAPAPAPTALELSGHTDVVSAVALDPSGAFAVSAGWDGTVRVWDLATGKARGDYPANGKPLFAVAVSPDGAWVAAGGAGPGAFRWKVGPDAALTAAPTLGGQTSRIGTVILSPAGRLFAVAADGTVWGWQTANGRVILPPPAEMKSPAGATTAALSPDGKGLLLGYREGGFVQMWTLVPTEYQTWFEGHTDVVHAAVFVGGGRSVATASEDGTVRVWDAATGKELRRLAHPGPVRALAATSDGKRIVTGCGDGRVRVWDVDKERERAVLSGHKGAVNAVALTADGLRAISGSDDKTVRVWPLPPAE